MWEGRGRCGVLSDLQWFTLGGGLSRFYFFFLGGGGGVWGERRSIFDLVHFTQRSQTENKAPS